MKTIKDEHEIREAERYMKLAETEAMKSKCKKSQRGVIIVKNRKIIGRGNNKVTLEKACNPCIREDIGDNSKVELCSAIHAEQLAIINAINNKENLKDSVMYHVKVKNGEMKKTGKPSCTVCSRMVLESGISYFVNWEKEGYNSYSAREFNESSFKYFLDKN